MSESPVGEADVRHHDLGVSAITRGLASSIGQVSGIGRRAEEAMATPARTIDPAATSRGEIPSCSTAQPSRTVQTGMK